MARIYLDARNITAQPAGVARYALSLIPELVRQAPQHDFVVIRHSSNRDPIDVLGCELTEAFVDRSIDNLDNFLLGSRTLRAVFAEHGPPDLYHDLFHILPLGLTDRRGGRGADPRIVVTLHDLVWIDFPHESQSSWLQAESIRLFARMAIPHSLKAADHVICVSEPTAQRARRWLRPGHHSTIYHGVTPEFFQSSPPPRGVLDQALADGEVPYVVAVGNAKDYKNLGRLVFAFNLARKAIGEAHLVLVGNCADLAPKIAAAGLEDHVTLTGFLSDAGLRQVLGHARLFVFPSLVEGFGLPVLEAMAMGVPTVVSDLEPMRTVGGQAALRVDPTDTEAMADAIERVLRDDLLHRRLAKASRERAAEFKWPLSARKTLQVYTKVLQG